MVSSEHVAPDALAQYLAGGLDRLEVARVEAHCQGCSKCARKVELRRLSLQALGLVVAPGQTLAYGDCFSLATWKGYLKGALSATERQQVEAHLSTCSICQDDIVVLRDPKGAAPRMPSGQTTTSLGDQGSPA